MGCIDDLQTFFFCTGPDGKLYCKACKKSFHKERFFKTHKCMPTTDYVDITRKNTLLAEYGMLVLNVSTETLAFYIVTNGDEIHDCNCNTDEETEHSFYLEFNFLMFLSNSPQIPSFNKQIADFETVNSILMLSAESGLISRSLITCTVFIVSIQSYGGHPFTSRML